MYKNIALVVLLSFLSLRAFAGENIEEEPSIAEPEVEHPPTTVIDSDTLEMIGEEKGARFLFSGNVSVTGNNLVVTCDQLEIFSTQGDNPGDTIGNLGRIQTIIATGRVRIVQEGREATAGRAEISPQAGTVVLTENPFVRDSESGATVSGGRMTLFQGVRRVVVDSLEGRPSRVELPSIPNLGFDENAN